MNCEAARAVDTQVDTGGAAADEGNGSEAQGDQAVPSSKRVAVVQLILLFFVK
jgi:hypothetical protein